MPARAQDGYAYLALLFAVALIGAGLGVAAEIWHTQAQREREQQLLWVGHQYRRAIEQYWRAGAATGAVQGQNPQDGTIPNGLGVPVPGTGGASPGGGLQGGAFNAGAGGPPGAGSGPGTPASGVANGGNSDPDTPVGTQTGNPLSAGLNSPLSSGLGTISGSQTRYPATLADLLSDKRTQQVRRHLRTLYPDPMTGKADWILVRAPAGGIMGVRSASLARPFKTDGFAPADAAFTSGKRYTDWIFQFLPAGAAASRGTANATPGGFGNAANGGNGLGASTTPGSSGAPGSPPGNLAP